MASINDNPIGVVAETRASWPEDPNDKGRVLLSLDLSPETNKLIEDLARQIKGSKGDVLRKAVGLFKLSMDAVNQGKKIGSVGPDQELDTEFVGF